MNNLLKHRCKLRNSKVRIYINQKLLIAIYSLYTDIYVYGFMRSISKTALFSQELNFPFFSTAAIKNGN